MDTFATEATFPPSLADNPILGMLTIMAFWWAVLICLQWFYTTVDQWFDHPAPSQSFVRINRSMKLWLLGSVLLTNSPRLLQLMLWQRMDSAEREMVSSFSWMTRIPGSFMLIVAWYLDKRIVAAEREYSDERGYYPAPAIARHEKTRGALVLALIFVVAAVTTFVRPADVHTHRAIIVERQ
jgi:hypothetical protein